MWFEHFLKHTNPSEARPVLLDLDGHKTHTTNLSFIEMARANFVSSAYHCSHRMQPLDVSFMKPLVTYYTQAVECWLRSHPGRVVSTFQMAELFFEERDFAAAQPTDLVRPTQMRHHPTETPMRHLLTETPMHHHVIETPMRQINQDKTKWRRNVFRNNIEWLCKY